MNRFRTPGFSTDPSRRRDGSRERWTPLEDDGGDLRPRRRVEDPDGRDDPLPALREERQG